MIFVIMLISGTIYGFPRSHRQRQQQPSMSPGSSTKLDSNNNNNNNRNNPRSNNVTYIVQHCLVHLGDIARYRNQMRQAETYYRQVSGDA